MLTYPNHLTSTVMRVLSKLGLLQSEKTTSDYHNYYSSSYYSSSVDDDFFTGFPGSTIPTTIPSAGKNFI